MHPLICPRAQRRASVDVSAHKTTILPERIWDHRESAPRPSPFANAGEESREVVLFPDLKATEEWRQRLLMLESVCRRATCSDLLEKMATDGQRSQGLDIADFLLMEDTPQMILARMIEHNPVLQTFIDTFGLELVDAGRVE